MKIKQILIICFGIALALFCIEAVATINVNSDLSSSSNSSSNSSSGSGIGGVDVSEIRGPLFTGNFSTWEINTTEVIDAQDFAGFYYDIEGDLSGETLTIYQNGTLNSRVLDADAVQNPLVYATNVLYSSPKFEFMLENNSSVPLLYQTVGFMGEQYASIMQDNVSRLSPILIDTNDCYILGLDQTLELEEGYSITPIQIDVNGESVWLGLSKNGGFIDDEIISTDSNETTSNRTWYYEREILGEDVLTLIVHVDEVFQDQGNSFCVIEGIWQISDQMTEVDLGDKYGKMIVSSIDNTSIIMELDDDIVLDAGSTNDLMENFEFKVADETILRFYLRKVLTEPGIYEIRGRVVDSPLSSETYSWNAHSFAGFWYDFDNNATSEVLTVHGIASLDRVIDANLGEMVYTTTMVPGIQPKFDFKEEQDPLTDWTYEKIGFLSEEYAPIKQDPQILTKILIDDDNRNLIEIGNSLDLGENYVVTPKEIDVEGDKVWLELTKNGTYLDDKVINASTNSTTSDKTWYYKQDILNESDVLTLMLHVGEVNQSGNYAIIDGIWQISDDFMKIAVGEEFGKMETTAVFSDSIELTSNEDIVLDAGCIVNLTDEFTLRVAEDSSNLRFYPFIEYNVIDIDRLIPLIDITSPVDGYSTTASSIEVSGLVNGTGSHPLVTVNDIDAETTLLDFNGSFTVTVPLAIGANTIYANVTDAAGNTNTTSVTVIRTSISTDNSGGGGSSGGSGGGGATGEAFENILVKDAASSNVVAGEISRYEFTEEKCHVFYIQFTGVSNAGKISTLIEVLKDTSTLVDSPAPGIVYQNINIWVGNAAFGDDKIKDAVISFRVSKKWLSEKSVDASSIVLYRYIDGKWNELSTVRIDEDSRYIYFDVETPGFSPFAIVGFEKEDEDAFVEYSTPSFEEEIPAVEDESVQSESKEIPWLSTGSLILIFVGVHLLMKKGG